MTGTQNALFFFQENRAFLFESISKTHIAPMALLSGITILILNKLKYASRRKLGWPVAG